MERFKSKTATSSRILGTPVDKRENARVVPSSTKAGSAPAVSVGVQIVKHSGRAGVLSHSRILKQRDSGVSEGKPASGHLLSSPQICFRSVGGLVSPVLKRLLLLLMSLLLFKVLQG